MNAEQKFALKFAEATENVASEFAKKTGCKNVAVQFDVIYRGKNLDGLDESGTEMPSDFYEYAELKILDVLNAEDTAKHPKEGHFVYLANMD